MIKIPDEIKALLKKDNVHKNVRIHFPNGEHEDITNENVIAESMVFTESLCSRDNLKFGLCESNVFQIETVGVGNIKGSTIKVSIEIQTDSGYYAIPIGTFIVDSCTKRYQGNRRYVIAYSELAYQNDQLCQLEKIKENYPVSWNDSYVVDLQSFFATNVKGYDISNATITEWDISIDARHTILYDDGLGHGVEIEWVFVEPTGKLTKAAFYEDFYGRPDEFRESEIKEMFDSFNGSFSDFEDDIVKWGCNAAYGVLYTKENTNGANIPEQKILDMFVADKSQYYKADANSGKIEMLFDGSYVAYNTITEYVHEYIDFVIMVPVTITNGRINSKGEIIEVYDTFSFFGRPKRYDIKLPEENSFVMKIPRIKNEKGKYVLEKELSVLDIMHSAVEIQGSFLKPSRYGGASLTNLQGKMGLYPSETLHPSETLYPKEPVEVATTSHCLSLWYDDYAVQPFGKIQVKYKDKNDETVVFVYEFDKTSPNIYYFDDNYIFMNYQFEESEIEKILDTYFIPKIKGVSFVPMEAEIKGLPHIEVGDMVSVLTKEGGFETFVMRRTMTGIKSLIDTLEAKGDEVNEDTTTTLEYMTLEGV